MKASSRVTALQCAVTTIVGLVLLSVTVMLLDLNTKPHLRNLTESLSKASAHKGAVTDYDFSIHEYTHIFNRPPPRGFAEWLKMVRHNQCLTTANAYAQIYNDLAPWFKAGSINASALTVPSGRSASQREYTSGSDFMLGLQTLLDKAGVKPFKYLVNEFDEPAVIPATDEFRDEVYANPQEMINHNACLQETYVDTGLADAHSFFLNPDTYISFNKLVPVFSQVKPQCYKDLLIPMAHNHIALTQSGHTLDKVSWSQKKTVLFWRGSTTDGHHGVRWPKWRNAHRMRAGKWANSFQERFPERVFDAGVSDPSSVAGPLMVDVGFYAYIQCDNAGCQEMKEQYPLKEKVSFEKTLEFKYLLVLDGNSWPNRLQRYLDSNSVILYNGIFSDWFNGQLRPWIHYVPVRLDLADLDDVLHWLQEHDEEARKITVNAKALMAQINRMEQLRCYTGLIFLEYSSLYVEQ
ncbi:glycosyl transferase family 90-domain-containing protein [Chytriomyces sp. MP71]|nr:glycosyl transferase family 90-domain-containing protein [Chytriomyces sp. MP71]